MPRLPDFTFEQHKIGETRFQALAALVEFDVLKLHGRVAIAVMYATPAGRMYARRTIDLFARWGYVEFKGLDGDAHLTHLGRLAYNYEKRKRTKALFDRRRAEIARELEQAPIDALADARGDALREAANKLPDLVAVSFRRAGGLPRLVRTPEGRRAIVEIAQAEILALLTHPDRSAARQKVIETGAALCAAVGNPDPTGDVDPWYQQLWQAVQELQSPNKEEGGK